MSSPISSANSEYVSPYARAGHWLRGNLHAHTCCGEPIDVEVLGSLFRTVGYDFLAVTDHNQTPGADSWSMWQRRSGGLVLIPGEENGDESRPHIVELGVLEVTPTVNHDYAGRARELRAGGGFVFAAHPQEYADSRELVRAAGDHLHAIEIYNGLREARGNDESKNLRIWDELLSEGRRIWSIACDDFHRGQISPGHGWIWLQVPLHSPVTWQHIVEQLKAGAYYGTTAPSFHTLELDDGVLNVTCDWHVESVRVIGPGGETLVAAKDKKLRWRPISGLQYFRVEAHSGSKRAWSQPFFRR